MVELLPVLLILYFRSASSWLSRRLNLGGASLMFAFLGMAISAFNPNDFGFLPDASSGS